MMTPKPSLASLYLIFLMRRSAESRWIVPLGIVLFMACLTISLYATAQTREAPTSDAHHGIDITALDRSVVVRTPADLYRFANGGWLDRTPLPADHNFISRWYELSDRTQLMLKSIAEQAASKPAPTGNMATDLVGQFYRLAMDEKRAERLGVTPLKAELQQIDRIHDRESLMAVLGRFASFPNEPGFNVAPSPDDKDNTRMLLVLSEGGLTHGSQMYLETDVRSKMLRAKLFEAYTRLFTLAHLPDAEAQARSSMALETVLAKASADPVALRDVAGNYHLRTLPQLQELTPGVPWGRFFHVLGIAPTVVDIAQPRFFAAFGKAVRQQPLSVWRSYLRANLLFTTSHLLSSEFVQAGYTMYRARSGVTASVPRWKIAIGMTDNQLGFALGQLYAARAFPPEARSRAMQMALNIKATLRERIQSLRWMSNMTKALAIKKLDAMGIKLGYPDKWRDYSGLHLRDDSYAQNVIRVWDFEWKRELATLNKPVDRNEFKLTPQTVNAFYDAHRNAIEVPAGWLQPGFFDVQADNASNYGAIGAIIGHEMIHGFDDRGSQYDAIGERKNWWTTEDRAQFDSKAAEIVAQYNGYVSAEGFPVNGKLTLSENIADIGGLAIAYLAYHKALGGSEPPLRDGLTGDQRFFIAYAQNSCAHHRPEEAKGRIATDWHAPESIRVLGPISDLPEFYKAFDLPVPVKLPSMW